MKMPIATYSLLNFSGNISHCEQLFKMYFNFLEIATRSTESILSCSRSLLMCSRSWSMWSMWVWLELEVELEVIPMVVSGSDDVVS